MKLRTLFKLLNFTIATILILASALAFLLFANIRHLNEAQEIRYKSYLAADELRQSSDDLTRLARTYVLSGDDRHEKMYWDILDIRNGKKPRPLNYNRIYWDLVLDNAALPRESGETKALEDIMKELGFTDAEFAKLEEAQRNSDELVTTETTAMNAVKGLFDDGRGKYTARKEPDPQMAARIMHDAAYHAEKAKIMHPINDFFEMLDERTAATVQHYARLARIYMQSIIALLVAATLLAFVSLFLFVVRIAQPLGVVIGLAGRARDGDLTIRREEFGAAAKDEIGQVADAVFAMIAKQREAIRAIASAAEKLGSTAEDFSAVAEEANAGVEESRAGADDVSSQMESLAATSEEITASVEEVASGAQAAAQKGTDMAEEVEQARVAGEEGTKAVEKVVASINGVAAEAVRSSHEVKSLGDRAREIQSFVAQIGGIADQTNLLALNAAIEAARAGEAGRGFAVVAEEVRKLAEDSNVAAKEIAALAAGITKDLDKVVSSSEKSANESQESSKLAGETRVTIEKMMEGLSRISAATQDLAAVSEEQAASSEEIASAVQSIASKVGSAAESSEMVRGQMSEVAGAAERVAQGSEELAGLSVELRRLVSAFKFEGGEESGLVPVKSAAKTR